MTFVLKDHTDMHFIEIPRKNESEEAEEILIEQYISFPFKLSESVEKAVSSSSGET